MRILVFCPLGPKGDEEPQLWGRSLMSIFRQEYTGEFNVHFRVGPDNPDIHKNEKVLEQYQFARQMALDGGYDALMCVESDIILPPDALQKLTALETDIAYGLYVFRHGRRQWSAYTFLKSTKGVSLSDDPEAAKARWGTVMEVAGVGQGCTLIHRRVLERIEFRLWPGTPWTVAPDWMLAYDAQQLGFRQVCDLSLVCGHMLKKPYPAIIWPDPAADRMYAVEPLDEMRQLKPGETVEIRVGMGVNEILAVREVRNDG